MLDFLLPSHGGYPSRSSIDTVIKTIRFNDYDLKMLMDLNKELEGDIIVRTVINEIVESVVTNGAIRMNEDHQSSGGAYTPLGGKNTSVVEDIRHHEDTPYILGGSSTVGVSKVPSCACEYLKCIENMSSLISKIEAFIEAQEVIEATINKLISKRGIKTSSSISEPFTPIGVKWRRN
ncbi:hypothetical protein HAX54_022194 [Datura stramonium]|uniref:Uncharacterized protein n=1 Tax=Datura stramonium TaxID=4076 RepID=A0ABS8S461_DATST|nr:hypothetical protein [Datura stramonium]